MAPRFASLYAILGLDIRSNPSPIEIKKAYHAAALERHPDKNPNDPRATARFQNVIKAYETLISTCVTVEKESEQDVANPQDSEETEDNIPFTMPNRMRKAFKKRKQKEANEEHQAAADVNKAEKRKVEALEARELHDLQTQIENASKKPPKEYLGEEDLVLSNLSACHQRALLLTRKELNKRNRKQQRPTLNANDPKHEKQEVTKADATKLRDQEKRDEEFRLFELPLNYVHPLDTETEEEIKNNRRPSFFAREEEENEKARALAEKLRKFWDDRVGEHGSACNEMGTQKTSKELKKPSPVQFAPKLERDPGGDEFRAAATARTREILETLAKEESATVDYGTTDDFSQEPVPSNDNLSLDDYVVSTSSWGTRNKLSEDSEEDDEEVVNTMRSGGPRKFVYEGNNLYRCRGCGTLNFVVEPKVVVKDSMAKCCKVQFGKKRGSPRGK